MLTSQGYESVVAAFHRSLNTIHESGGCDHDYGRGHGHDDDRGDGSDYVRDHDGVRDRDVGSCDGGRGRNRPVCGDYVHVRYGHSYRGYSRVDCGHDQADGDHDVHGRGYHVYD